jgi:hypothetical protein
MCEKKRKYQKPFLELQLKSVLLQFGWKIENFLEKNWTEKKKQKKARAVWRICK